MSCCGQLQVVPLKATLAADVIDGQGGFRHIVTGCCVMDCFA